MGFDFTVVVPAYNESHYIEPTLRSIREQTFGGRVELIVVDNNSTDNTSEVAAKYADVVLRYAERQGAAAARQHGAEHARGDVIAFLDADTQMSPNLLATSAAALAAGAVGGRAPLKIDDSGFGPRWAEACVNVWQRFIGPTFIPYVYAKRDVFLKTGGWELDITCAEEVRLQKKIAEQGKLHWDTGAYTLTHARRYIAEGYYLLAVKGVIAQFFGVNMAWEPIRGLPPGKKAKGGALPASTTPAE
jgi:glycosyltransferase involved in cell wall biosynthesis